MTCNYALKPPLYSNFALPWQCDIMEYSSIQNNILLGVPKNGSAFDQQYNKRLSEILPDFAE